MSPDDSATHALYERGEYSGEWSAPGWVFPDDLLLTKRKFLDRKGIAWWREVSPATGRYAGKQIRGIRRHLGYHEISARRLHRRRLEVHLSETWRPGRVYGYRWLPNRDLSKPVWQHRVTGSAPFIVGNTLLNVAAGLGYVALSVWILSVAALAVALVYLLVAKIF